MQHDFSHCHEIIDNVARVFIGKKEAVKLLLVAVLAEGHIVVEDVPGLGKTLLAKALARSMGGVFKRVQFTPDLLPADITGFNVFNQKTGCFDFQPGPVMTNVLLADEINRTIPRTQASLLESMEERQVTVDGKTYRLPLPFIVLATQNPIELEGTFPLPEAQLDRFLMRITLGYPSPDEENAILERFQSDDPLEDLKAVSDPSQIVAMQRICRKIHVSAPIRAYITELVGMTRRYPAFSYGASPRGSLGLMKAAQAQAALDNRPYVLPDDVKTLFKPVLAHRIILKDEERLRGNTTSAFLDNILNQVTPPVTSACSCHECV